MSFEDFALRVDDALAPGIAAELAAWIPRMPVGPTVDPGHDALWWSCDAELPMRPDPRLPECFFQLGRFFDVELPARAAAITGRRLAWAQRGHFSLRLWRKGSFADGTPEIAAGSIEAVIGLTAGSWPDDWGGIHHVLDQQLRPGWNTLDLIGGAPAQRRTLIIRNVEVVTLHTTLVEVPS